MSPDRKNNSGGPLTDAIKCCRDKLAYHLVRKDTDGSRNAIRELYELDLSPVSFAGYVRDGVIKAQDIRRGPVLVRGRRQEERDSR